MTLLADLKKRIASAEQTHVADEKAAKEAEAVAAPLKVEAEKTRAAYLAARNIAKDKHALAQQAKAGLGPTSARRGWPEPPLAAKELLQLDAAAKHSTTRPTNSWPVMRATSRS